MGVKLASAHLNFCRAVSNAESINFQPLCPKTGHYFCQCVQICVHKESVCLKLFYRHLVNMLKLRPFCDVAHYLLLVIVSSYSFLATAETALAHRG